MNAFDPKFPEFMMKLAFWAFVIPLMALFLGLGGLILWNMVSTIGNWLGL